jgi:hypothetical protein
LEFSKLKLKKIMKSKLNFDKKSFHQGDVQFFQLNKLPKGIKKIEKQFIAASERSGSFHALFGNYDIYEFEDGGFVIDAHEECILNHSLQSELRGLGVSLDKAMITAKKDHRHTVVPAGKYFVGIQIRFDPLENAKKNVTD